MVSAIHDRSNQWGRKDPFTPATTNYTEVQIYKADGTAITKGDRGIATLDKLSEFTYEARTTTTQTTINHLIQNPSTHYGKGDGTNYVPIASTTDLTKDWWNPTIKTIYDPCPNGYRIPKDGTYSSSNQEWDWDGNVISLTSGMIWRTTFFPASGLRHNENGKFNAVSESYYSWMSTPYSLTHGYSLYIGASYIHQIEYPRARNYPTRCIKE